MFTIFYNGILNNGFAIILNDLNYSVSLFVGSNFVSANGKTKETRQTLVLLLYFIVII